MQKQIDSIFPINPSNVFTLGGLCFLSLTGFVRVIFYTGLAAANEKSKKGSESMEPEEIPLGDEICLGAGLKTAPKDLLVKKTEETPCVTSPRKWKIPTCITKFFCFWKKDRKSETHE